MASGTNSAASVSIRPSSFKNTSFRPQLQISGHPAAFRVQVVPVCSLTQPSGLLLALFILVPAPGFFLPAMEAQSIRIFLSCVLALLPGRSRSFSAAEPSVPSVHSRIGVPFLRSVANTMFLVRWGSRTVESETVYFIPPAVSRIYAASVPSALSGLLGGGFHHCINRKAGVCRSIRQNQKPVGDGRQA